ncbi:hypothetical protein ACFQ9X_45820 [Catenulispora yoronensis]
MLDGTLVDGAAGVSVAVGAVTAPAPTELGLAEGLGEVAPAPGAAPALTVLEAVLGGGEAVVPEPFWLAA